MLANTAYRLGSSGDSDGSDGADTPDGTGSAEREYLPYTVELWTTSKKQVELVLAVTASGSIGYAAYFAATREFPDRYVTLRHKNGIISRWNGPVH